MSKNKQVLRRCLKCCAGDEVEHCIICGRLLVLKEELKKRRSAMKDYNYHAWMTLDQFIIALDEIEKIELEER